MRWISLIKILQVYLFYSVTTMLRVDPSSSSILKLLLILLNQNPLHSDYILSLIVLNEIERGLEIFEFFIKEWIENFIIVIYSLPDASNEVIRVFQPYSTQDSSMFYFLFSISFRNPRSSLGHNFPTDIHYISQSISFLPKLAHFHCWVI